jgi:hypothetical protein
LQHREDEVARAALGVICQYVCEEVPPESRGKQVSYEWRGREVTTFADQDPVELEAAAVEALKCMGTSPWFGRGWVIQEVVLCTSACVYWGHAEIDFAWIGVAAFVATRSADAKELAIGSTPIRHCLFMYLMYGTAYRSIRVVSFFTLLLNTTEFAFSEAKDRVYGLLGLQTLECNPADDHPFVDPNYSISTMKCYRRITAKLLVGQNDLRVLSWTLHGANSRQDWP